MRRPGPGSLLGCENVSADEAPGARPPADGPARSPGVPLALVLAGATLVAVSVFAPVHTPVGDTLWTEGTGWALVAAAALVAGLTMRVCARGGWSWSGLWLGALALLNAVAMARDSDYRPVGLGLVVLAAGGVLTLVGWGLGLAALRPRLPWLDASLLTRRLSRDAAPGAARAIVWPLGAYLAVSLAYWAWPVARGFATTLIAANDIDPSVYTWFYGWWPHAVLHGENPFITRAIFAPEGYNLTWVTSVPLPSLLMTPVTLALGPVVTYNVLALVAPALAAWTAFLLCRHLTGRVAPALVGGYLFGFSPFVLRMLQGAPNLYMIALVPVLVLLVVRRMDRTLSERAFVVAMAVAVAAQFLTSLEVMVTTTISGSVALVAAFLIFPDRRRLLMRTVALIVAAYAGAAVLSSPWLFFMAFYDHTTPSHNSPIFAGDLLGFVLPDSSLAAASSHQLGGTPGYYGGLGYLGVPLLLIAAVCALRCWGDRVVRLGIVCLGVIAVASLGPRLFVGGKVTDAGLPWSLLSHLAYFDLLIPQRFTFTAFLAGAVVTSLWLAGRGAAPIPARWALAALAVASFVPNVGMRVWKTDATDPAFFSSGAYRSVLGPDDRVLPLPINGRSMRWQASARFAFTIVGGGVGAFPASYERYPAFDILFSDRDRPDAPAQLRRFIEDKGVTVLVTDEGSLTPQRRRLFATLGARPLRTGGVVLYRLGRPAAGAR